METKDLFMVFIILFVLLGLAFSPFKKANLNSSNDSKNASTIGTNSSSDKDVTEGIKKAEEEIKKLEESLSKKIDESGRSPYYGKITMSSISGLFGDDPNQEYIYFYTNLDKKEIIKINGWYLKSEITGYFAVIGKAALLPFPFTKTESDIVLQQEDRVYLTKGFSPIGISFRTNKCTGYFEENRTFVPSLSLQCPRPIDEKLPNFSSVYDRNDECLDIIDNIYRCTTVSNQFVRDLPDTVSESCKTYMTTQINYNSCIALHFSDTDFPGNEYRVYLNKFGPLWRKTHDTINLHDQNGLVVDTISY